MQWGKQYLWPFIKRKNNFTLLNPKDLKKFTKLLQSIIEMMLEFHCNLIISSFPPKNILKNNENRQSNIVSYPLKLYFFRYSSTNCQDLAFTDCAQLIYQEWNRILFEFYLFNGLKAFRDCPIIFVAIS